MATSHITPSFKFDIPAIDDQHQVLIDLITRLEQGVSGFLPNMFAVLDELQKYVRDLDMLSQYVRDIQDFQKKYSKKITAEGAQRLAAALKNNKVVFIFL